MRRKKAIRKPIAFQPNTIAIEDLPYKVVHYPGFYGTFFGFQRDEKALLVLCSCSREAIENYIRLRLAHPPSQNSDPTRMFILGSAQFPMELVKRLMKLEPDTGMEVINSLNFHDKLCHECNTSVPSFRYCHEMYGGSFKQNFGWYVSKQLLQFGIHPFTFPILPDSCPQELLALAVLDPREAYARRLTLLESDRDKADELSKKLERQHRAIWNFAENEVRLKFGHKKIGDAWTSETILYSIVRSLFPDAQVLRHYRPTFLEGLEIDIFVTDPVIGIEYQGIQHFRPVAHWGGKDALVQLRERDKRKAAICHAEGIPLVHFNYDEPLSKDFVSDRLNKILDTHS